MGKTNVHISLDYGLKEMAHSKGINISDFVNHILKTELEIKELADATTKDELISKLKTKISLLTSELELKGQEIKILKDKMDKQEKEYKKKLDECD